ncbi:hypothetical protein [Paenibacillus sp. 8b26]|uniref:hypothetical protein n=1 Tax=Paenibacillus sp. 8b26 TaxID=3424133 RepID=UPI003D653764
MRKIYIVLIALGIFGVWAGSGWAINTWINASYRGTFGDMFGAVNALFSGLAFAGLIYTISVQRDELQEQKKAIEMQTEELSLQRQAIEMQTEELRMQREETARSADQLESQRNLMNLQIAMTTVNELIKSKNKRIDNIRYQINGQDEKGILALTVLAKRSREMNRPIAKDDAVLQGFYRSFFYTLQYIKELDLDKKQKKVLSNLLNMDTSDTEIYILYTAFANEQHELLLLKEFDFYERYRSIKEKSSI